MHYKKNPRARIKSIDYNLDFKQLELINFLSAWENQKPSSIINRCVTFARKRSENERYKWSASAQAYKKKKILAKQKQCSFFKQASDKKQEAKQLYFSLLLE